jgi:hypothetical protein
MKGLNEKGEYEIGRSRPQRHSSPDTNRGVRSSNLFGRATSRYNIITIHGLEQIPVRLQHNLRV